MNIDPALVAKEANKACYIFLANPRCLPPVCFAM